jgi:predicted transcriptional regulator
LSQHSAAGPKIALATGGIACNKRRQQPSIVQGETCETEQAKVERSELLALCLDCGKKLKMLKRHLMTDHGLAPEEYRA